jgi:hypothetical protein
VHTGTVGTALDHLGGQYQYQETSERKYEYVGRRKRTANRSGDWTLSEIVEDGRTNMAEGRLAL